MRRIALAALVLLGLATAAADARATEPLDDFARCLRREDATLWGAVWCRQCEAQRRLFGRSSRWVPYVECSIDGTQALRPECARVAGFPTWTFRDGSRHAGRLSLQQLSAKSGCGLDEPLRDQPRTVDVPAAGELPSANDSGVEIIEIP